MRNDIQIDLRDVNGVRVVACSGAIKLGETASHFRNTFREVLHGGAKTIVVDITGIEYLDSTGIGEFVLAFNSAADLSATVRFSGMNEEIRGLMRITKLDTVFEIFSSEADAVASYA